MGRIATTIVSAFVAAALSATAADAATRYAEPNGDGPAATCPKSDPCDVQVAAENASGGDEVILEPGNYNLGSAQLAPTPGVDIGGERGGPKPPRIVSSHETAVMIGFNGDTLIHDVEIDHAGSFTALFMSAGRAERVVASTSTGSAACRGSQFGIGFIRDSVCWNSATAAGVRAGFTLETDSNVTFSSTYKLRNVTAVASGGEAATAYGLNLDVDVAGSGNPALVIDARNTIAVGANGDVRAKTGCNGPCGTGQATATATLANSNYSTAVAAGLNASVTPAGTNGNQTAEPVFENAPGGDFRQAENSPTRDAGDSNVDLLGEFDLLGGLRVAGPSVDIGAHEFDDSPPTVTLTKTPPEKTTRRKATFRFEADESVTFECAIDQKAPRSCGSPRKYGRVKPGLHTFEVTASDPSGNQDSAVYQWKVKK